MIKENIKHTKGISCPFCKQTYEPCDIFIPDYLIGKKFLRKNPNGTLNIVEKFPQELEETYECDGCGKTFKVQARLEFLVTPNEHEDVIFEDTLKISLEK